MNAFRDRADRGVQQSYAISHFSERVVMDSHGLMDPLVARRLVGDARKRKGVKPCFLYAPSAD